MKPEPTDQELIQTLAGVLNDHPTLKLAILYGSYAAGRQRPDSDVDLAVAEDSRRPVSEEKLVDLSLECSSRLGRELQVRDLARAPGVFLKQVLTTGVVVMQRDPAVRAELIIRMLDFDAVTLDKVRMIRKRNRERLIAGQ